MIDTGLSNTTPARRQAFALGALLVLVTLALFWPVMHGFVSYDDGYYVTENAIVQQGLTWRGAAWAFRTTHASNWHPVTWLSHMLDVSIFGVNAGAHHLVNVFLHAANALLLFLLLHRLTRALWPSALVAALFAWHPLHVESVAWVAERKDVLSTLFWLLTIAAYARYVERPAPGRYGLALALFTLGLMTKPMVVTLPFTLLLLDHWPLRRIALGANWRRLVWEKAPFLVLSATSCVVTVLAQSKGGAIDSLARLPITSRLANAITSYAAYLGKALCPVDLAVFYPLPTNWPVWSVAFCALLLTVITIVAIRSWRTRPWLTVGWFWFLGTLVPVIGLVQAGGQAMADRYTYLPLIGMFIILAWAAAEWTARQPRVRTPLTALGAGAAVGCAALTNLQLPCWRDSVALFDHALKVTGENYVAHNNLAVALKTLGDTPQANAHYFEAVRIKPNFALAHYNLALNLAEAGQTTQALHHFAEVTRLRKDTAEKRNAFGLVLGRTEHWAEAVDQFTEAAQRDPASARTQFNLAYALNESGRTQESIARYREALRLQPDWPEAVQQLAWLLSTTDGTSASDRAEAVRLAEQLCAWTNRQIAVPLDVLAAAYAQAGRFSEATATAAQAIKLANTAGQKELAAQIEQRRRLYESGQPWRLKPPVHGKEAG